MKCVILTPSLTINSKLHDTSICVFQRPTPSSQGRVIWNQWISTFPSKSVPKHYRKSAPFAHSSSQYNFILVVVFKCQRINGRYLRKVSNFRKNTASSASYEDGDITTLDDTLLVVLERRTFLFLIKILFFSTRIIFSQL